ncbi:MAG: type VI secretion system baseplate subunit TssK [Bacteroidota bacterium]
MSLQSPKYSPNWMDGMKISHHHLEQWEDVQLYRQQQGFAMVNSSFHYGLIYLGEQTNQPISRVGNKIIAKACAGVSKGGFPFRLPAYDGHEVSLELEKLDMTEKAWYIVLKIHLYDRQEAGNPDPDEEPPRSPYSVPRYELKVAFETRDGVKLSPNEVIIGKLKKTATDGVELDDQYIPPCLQLSHHSQLLTEVKAAIDELETVIRNGESVMKKIQGSPSDHKDELSQPLLHLSQWIIPSLIHLVEEFKFWGKEAAPVYFFSRISMLGRMIQSSLASRPERQAGELKLINYFIEGAMLRAEQAHSLEKGLGEFHYLHHDIRTILTQTQFFVEALGTLYKNLDSEKRYVWEKVHEHRVKFRTKGKHTDG